MTPEQYLKNIIKEEIAPFKKMLSETSLVPNQAQQSTTKAANFSASRGKEPLGLPTIDTKEGKKDFTRWVMDKFGKNIPEDLSAEQVEKILFSANEEKIKTLKLTMNPNSLGKLYVTKMQLGKSLSSDKMDKTLAAYDVAYEEKENKGKKNITSDEAGGETLDTIATQTGLGSKARADQVFNTAKAKMMGRAMIGGGSLKEMNRVVLSVANQAADLYVKILIGAVKIALTDKNAATEADRDFSAIDFVEGLNSQVLKRKPDYAVEEADITNEELTAIQYFGDEIEKYLKMRDVSKLADKQAEIIDMLIDDFASGEGDGRFLQYFASVIKTPKIEELGTKVGTGISRVNLDKIELLQKRINSLETEKDISNSEKDQSRLEAEIASLKQQVSELKVDPEHNNLKNRLSDLATELADLETEMIVYGAASPGKSKEAQSKMSSISSRMEEIEAE